MVEFVKGKALIGAIVVLIGGLIQLLGSVIGFTDPLTWTLFETNATVILPGVLALVFGILVVFGGLWVAMGNSKGNYIALFIGLLGVILWLFLLPPPAPIPYETYIKIPVPPFLYLVGGLFGISITQE